MNTVKRRIQYLFYVLAHQNNYVRASELAEKAGVTERTIKSDIVELSDYAKQSGAELVSKKGVGYRLVARDIELMDKVYKQLDIYYFYMGDSMNSQNIRINEILRRVIAEEEYLTIEQVIEELFLTKSAVREEIKKVHTYLSHYNLCWKKKNESGPLIQGTELDRRRLMLCVFETPYHEATVMYTNNSFLKWFDYDQQMRYQIRHRFLEVLRQSDCRIRDDYTQYLSRYLCLMVNRVSEGFCISFTESQRKYIRQLRQSLVARKVIFELAEFPGFLNLPEDEILGFGLLLAEWTDVSSMCDFEKSYSFQLKEAKQFLKKYIARIKQEYGIELNRFDNYEKCLLPGLFPLLIQKDFNSLSQDVKITYQQDERVKDCPLAVQMAYDAAFLFEEIYGIRMSIHNLLTFSSYLHALFLSVEYDYKPIRALICTSNGLMSTNALKRLIESNYGRYFEKMDCFELYEMRGMKKEDYDCVIMSLPFFSYRYDWPCLVVDSVPTQRQMNEIYNRFVLGNVQLKEALGHLKLKKINVYSDVEYQSDEEFIKILSYKMGKDSDSVKMIERSLKTRSPICVYNKVCVLFVKKNLTSSSCFDIYQLASEKTFVGEKVSCIVVMSLDFDGSLQAARFINDATYMFFADDSNLMKVIETGKLDELVSVVRASLKALPISLSKGK